MYGLVLREEGWDTPTILRFKSNADVSDGNHAKPKRAMSLNRYEQAIFEYWEKQPDEKRHWRAKVESATCGLAGSPQVARELERELWAYAQERSPFVATLGDVTRGGRVSFLNLAELVIRIWGPIPKPKPKTG